MTDHVCSPEMAFELGATLGYEHGKGRVSSYVVGEEELTLGFAREALKGRTLNFRLVQELELGYRVGYRRGASGE